MKLQHHLGGLKGLDGPIDFEKRVVVEDWEKRIIGIHIAMMGLSRSLRDAVPDYDLDSVPSTFSSEWTWADLRKGAESMNPFAYFQFRYYEKWLGGITAHFVDQGYLSQEELDAAVERYRANPGEPLPDRAEPAIDDQVVRYLREGDTPRRGPAAPLFAVGDEVVVRNPPPADHTRLPGYLRARTGVVERVSEDTYTYFCSTGEDGLDGPVPVYVVRFEPDEIWGAAGAKDAGPLYAEIYECYLTPGERGPQ